MKGLLIFAGTSEGRELFTYFARSGIPCTASTATEYGASLLSDISDRYPCAKVIYGRLFLQPKWKSSFPQIIFFA